MIPIDKRPGNKSKIWKSHTLPERPENLPEMIEIAEMLSEPFDFIRVDLISGEDTLYVGELTHCHTSATQYFSSKEDEILLSEIIFGDSKYDSKI